MKRKLQRFDIPLHSQEWFDFRLNGIGGSEMGTILNLNPYETAARVFHEKIGNMEPNKDDSEFMFWGREHEDKIAEVWQYWDGTDYGYLDNRAENKIIRRCRNVNGYVINPDFPWLFASLDRLINIEGGRNMFTGEPLTEESVLECKTLSYWGALAWEDGMPIYYLTQIHTYMIIFEVDYAEIAILTDGNKFRVEYIKRDDKLCDSIINISKAWWYDRVVPGKQALVERDANEAGGNVGGTERNESIINRLEPEPDETEAYKKFQSEKFLKEREEIQGTLELFDLCKKDEMLKKISGRIVKERDKTKNILIKWIVERGAEIVDFGKLGKYRYYLRKGSKERTLSVGIKEKPSEERVEMEFRKINTDYRS